MSTPFDIEKRKTLTPLQRAKLFAEHNGTCVVCRHQIDGVRQRWIVEHIMPLERGGTNDWSNLGPAHEYCAREKTKEDHSRAAKDKRVYARHIGAHIPKRPMPGSRHSPWKKKLNGQVVRREK